MSLKLREAVVRRGAFRLSADFETPTDGVTVVFGPSGAGKSMLLSSIAGLHRLETGRVEFNGRVLEDAGARSRIAAHARGIGLVFQDARLFPHRTVRGNIEYAERRRPAARNAPIVVEIARRLEIEELLNRPVRNLSGGERSRVALARAIVSAPELLLLDEPFAALDGRRRRAFLTLLRELSREQSLPMMIVTHQVDEVAEVADNVVAVTAGRVVGHGAASDVMRRAEFAALLDRRDLGARVDAGAVAGGHGGGGVWIRADSVLLAAEEPRGISARNVWRGTIASIVREIDGAVLVSLATEAGYISARITPEALADLQLDEGATAWAVVKSHAL
ncbi:MAG: ATP-binding cassette domain-containing protein [Hyphomonadaceae bacterium]|nr:ATP-binding cassette domain-containing protein [Hyphomonadaceae bacterium]